MRRHEAASFPAEDAHAVVRERHRSPKNITLGPRLSMLVAQRDQLAFDLVPVFLFVFAGRGWRGTLAVKRQDVSAKRVGNTFELAGGEFREELRVRLVGKRVLAVTRLPSGIEIGIAYFNLA